MPQIAKLIGGAGTGKTAELLRVMQATVAKAGGDPFAVGFVSFTRAARREASSRASKQFSVPIYQLEHHGWFRTIHSTCKQCLGVGDELLTDTKDSRVWIEAAIQEPIGTARREPDGFYTDTTDDGEDATRALHLWNAARNRLERLADVWQEADDADPRTPPLAYCLGIVERYEQSKRLDHRVDFVDLLAQFAGWRFSLEYGPERCEPRGEPPELKAWFFDEQQDTSALLHSVCERLASACDWLYVAGDPFQSIYGWNGASPAHFNAWQADKTQVMPRSYRCPAPVLELGERFLRPCSDYWDRRISPAEHDGTCELESTLDALEVDPQEEWLLLARTNYLAGTIAKHLDRHGVPWVSTHGGSRWQAPVRNGAIQALADLQAGAPIDGGQWRDILKFLPARLNGKGPALLMRGTKKRFAEMDDAQAAYPWVMPHELSELGATEQLVAGVQSGAWRQWIGEAAEYLAAVEHWGLEAVQHPRVRVGTIHSAKGAEADNVVVLTALSMPCVRGAESQAGHDEQQRVFYVGVTRARRRLVVLDDARNFHRQDVPTMAAEAAGGKSG